MTDDTPAPGSAHDPGGTDGAVAGGAAPGAHVHVVRGAPDDVELAALVAGLAAAAGAGDDVVEHGPRGAWSDRSRALRGPGAAPSPGPDAWRWSLRG